MSCCAVFLTCLSTRVKCFWAGRGLVDATLSGPLLAQGQGYDHWWRPAHLAQCEHWPINGCFQ